MMLMGRGEASCICDFIVEITTFSDIRQKQIWANYIHLRLMKKPYKSVCRQTDKFNDFCPDACSNCISCRGEKDRLLRGNYWT